MDMYYFDTYQKLMGVISENSIIEAHLTKKINQGSTMNVEITSDVALPEDARYLLIRDPDGDEYLMFTIQNRKYSQGTVTYTTIEYAWEQLTNRGLVKDYRPQNKPVRDVLNDILIQYAVEDDNWEIRKCNLTTRVKTSFYYLTRTECLTKLIDIIGRGELEFHVDFDGNKIVRTYVDFMAELGSSNVSYWFEWEKNLMAVTNTSDESEIYASIVPRGKGELVSEGKDGSPDGYGRRIGIEDITWSKGKGDPLNKPHGSPTLTDGDVQAKYGRSYRLVIFEDIDDPNQLIQAAYRELKKHNHKQVQYSASVLDGQTVQLGDHVVIRKPVGHEIAYETRVFMIEYDLLRPQDTRISLGDDLTQDSLGQQISNMSKALDAVANNANWGIQNSDGTNSYYGEKEPEKAKEGDIWFKALPNGTTEIWRYENGSWQMVVNPNISDDIKKQIQDALKSAQDYADQLNQKTQRNIDRVEGIVQDNALKTDTALKNSDDQINAANQKISDVDDQIKQEIQNRLASEGAILDKTDSKITAAVKDKADISYVDMRANGILASVQSTNLVENSEFQYDDSGIYYGWTLNNQPIDTKTFRPNGMQLVSSSQYQGQSQTVVYNGKPDKLEWLRSPKLQVQAGTHLTASLGVVVRDTAGLVSLSISAYDANGQKLNRYYQDITKQWEWQTYQIETNTPVGTQYVQFELAVRGTIFITQPFLGIQPKWTGYSIGKAGVSSSLMITNDRITSTVKDYTGKIATLNQRFDGFDMKVSNTNSQLESLRTQTSDLIAQGVRDRQNGDVSTLSQAKNAIALAVQDKVTKSELAVTTEGILATVQTVNLLSNSEFDLANNKIYGWYAGSPVEKWLPLDGTLPFGNNAFWPKARNFIGDKTRYQYPTTKLYHDDTMDDVGVTHWLKSEPVSVRPNEVIETSIEGLISSNSNAELDPVISLRLVFYDSDKKVLSEKSIVTRVVGESQALRLSGSINDGLVRGVGISVGVRGKVDLSRPQLTSGTGTDKTYIPTKMGAGAVLSLSTDSFALGIKNNADKIISGINGDESGIKLTGNKILLDGNVTANGDFWAQQVNAVKVNASNILTGTLDASKANIININASQITTGTLDGRKIHISNGKNSLFVDAGGISVSTRDTLQGNEQPIIQIQTLNRQVWLGSAGETNRTRTYGNLSLQGANFIDGKPITGQDWQEVMNIGYLTKDRKIMLPTGMYFNPAVADLIGMGRRERAFADFSIDKSGDAEMQFNLRVGGEVNVDGHGMKVERLWAYDGAPSLQLTVYNLDGVKRPGLQLSGNDNNIGLAFGPGAIYTVYNGKYTKLA